MNILIFTNATYVNYIGGTVVLSNNLDNNRMYRIIISGKILKIFVNLHLPSLLVTNQQN